MLRRSTKGIIWRLAGVLGFIIAVHVCARFAYVLMSNERVYTSDSSSTDLPFDGRTFWNYSFDAFGDTWSANLGFHFLGFIGTLLILLLSLGVYSLIRWIFVEEARVVCHDPKCRCALHGGVSYAQYQKELDSQYTKFALIAAAAAVIGASISN